jgi:hypothetical protein
LLLVVEEEEVVVVEEEVVVELLVANSRSVWRGGERGEKDWQVEGGSAVGTCAA